MRSMELFEATTLYLIIQLDKYQWSTKATTVNKLGWEHNYTFLKGIGKKMEHVYFFGNNEFMRFLYPVALVISIM